MTNEELDELRAKASKMQKPILVEEEALRKVLENYQAIEADLKADAEEMRRDLKEADELEAELVEHRDGADLVGLQAVSSEEPELLTVWRAIIETIDELRERLADEPPGEERERLEAVLSERYQQIEKGTRYKGQPRGATIHELRDISVIYGGTEDECRRAAVTATLRWLKAGRPEEGDCASAMATEMFGYWAFRDTKRHLQLKTAAIDYAAVVAFMRDIEAHVPADHSSKLRRKATRMVGDAARRLAEVVETFDG